jgi:hypothetical protein
MSTGAVFFAHTKWITERNSHLAGEASGSSISNGCQAKTEHRRQLAGVGTGRGGTKLHVSAPRSRVTAFLTTAAPWEHYFMDNLCNMLCDGIILQKRFVKELYCRNALWRRVIEIFGISKKKMYNIKFLSNIFQSDVINVTLCSLLIKTKQILFIYYKNCISYSVFSNTLQFFKCPTASQQQRAFKLTPVTCALHYFKMAYDKG